MEIKASARFVRMSPRKVRLVINMIRGKKAADALDILEFSTRWAKRPISKLLESAIANAEHNFKLQKENLYVKTIKADGGPMMKRWTPRAFGRATPIRKRTSHITIVLDELKKDEVKKEIKNAEKKPIEKPLKNSKSKTLNSKQIQNKKSKK